MRKQPPLLRTPPTPRLKARVGDASSRKLTVRASLVPFFLPHGKPSVPCVNLGLQWVSGQRRTDGESPAPSAQRGSGDA